MDIDIKYNYPHAFFLSVAVITLIFGFYPFYVNNFDYSSMHWTRILIHGISIIISVVCLWKGFSLWSDKERKREEFEEIRKKRMEQEVTLNQQKLEESDLKNRIIRLIKDKETLKKDKIKEIEKLNKELQSKEQEIAEAKTELYDLKKDEISKLPNNFSSSALTSYFSGASCFPISASGAYVSPISTVENSYLNAFSKKKCNACGAQISFLDSICPKCGSYII